MSEVQKEADETYCASCGAIIKIAAEICPKCGVRREAPSSCTKSMLIITWLFGIHYFYVGNVGLGILYLITFAGCGIWWLVDLIRICQGDFTDSKGNKIKS